MSARPKRILILDQDKERAFEIAAHARTLLPSMECFYADKLRPFAKALLVRDYGLICLTAARRQKEDWDSVPLRLIRDLPSQKLPPPNVYVTESTQTFATLLMSDLRKYKEAYPGRFGAVGWFPMYVTVPPGLQHALSGFARA